MAASDGRLGLSPGLVNDWFAVDNLALPGGSFLLPKRVIQINSELPKLKLNVPKICQALKGDDEGAKPKRKAGGPTPRAPKLDLQAWKTLRRILPGATVDGVQNPVAAVDEFSAIRAATLSGGGKPRPPAERFVLAMVAIPGAEQRVSLRILEREWVVGVTGPGKAGAELLEGRQRLQLVLDEVRDAFAELRAASDTLGVLFGLVLQIGNYVNGGTGRGGAHGFALQDCLRLSQVKSEGGDVLTKNLLEFVVQTAAQHEAADGGALLRWPAALPHLQAASAQSMQAVGDSLRDWARRVATARLEAAALRQALSGGGACWDAIVDKVEEELSQVHSLFEKLQEEQAQLEAQFGFEPLDEAEGGTSGGSGGGDEAEEAEARSRMSGGLLCVLSRFASEWEKAAEALQLQSAAA
jgi:hypothetical protein